MAPELEKGHEYDLAVDCWSLGVVFYILLCGRHPFPHGLNKQIRKHLRKHTCVPVLCPGASPAALLTAVLVPAELQVQVPRQGLL